MSSDESNNNLSLIDCGIKSLKEIPLKYNLTSINLHSNQINKIENLTYLQHLCHLDLSSNKISKIFGLHGLVSLKVLNLSCNQIVSIENLDGLKNLQFLNLSYNKIQYINGLSDLWGNDYSIETILLNSNFISSLEEISYYLNGLSKLKHLTLNENKFLKSIDYRSFLFKHLKHLISLDGKDKSNKNVNYKTPNHQSTFLEEFIEYSKQSSIKIPEEEEEQEEEEEDSVSSLGPKLDKIEDKIHKLLFLRDKIKNHNEQDILESRFIQRTKPLVSILKPSINHQTTINQSTITDESMANSSSNLNDLIKTLQDQLLNYKSTQDENLNLINELKTKLEENLKCLKEKEEEIKIEKEKNKQFEILKVKLEQCEIQFESKEEKIKYSFENEIKCLKEKQDLILKEKNDKIENLQQMYKQLEDEFRQALIIESNRFNELFVKYEIAAKEHQDLKNSLKIAEQNETRNKSLINELNDLIKEQKNRLNVLSKMRKESAEDIQKRNEKLNEAVADCVKLKAQCEQLKKDKQTMEINLKKILTEFESIKKERFTWNNKLNEQKNFFLQENNRLEIENKKIKSEFDQASLELRKEADNCKIKSKIIEDQTESIKKLKNALIERDEMLKKSREDALNTQKSLEKQLNDEMDLSNELQIKLQKLNEKKEALKSEKEKLNFSLEETKRAYEELAQKWKQKSDLINELDVKVRKMKENFDLKEKALLEKNEKLTEENAVLNNRLRKIDDDFRQQYDAEKKDHLRQLEKVKNEHVTVVQSYENKIKDLEDEMREILIESEKKKKFYDEKISGFSALFSKFQADLKTNN